MLPARLQKHAARHAFSSIGVGTVSKIRMGQVTPRFSRHEALLFEPADWSGNSRACSDLIERKDFAGSNGSTSPT